MRWWVFLALTGSAVTAASAAESVRPLADRIEKLAARESIESAIDTRLRAAQLLMTVDSEVARKFLVAGIDQLRMHPEVPRLRTVTATVVAMDLPEADELLLAGTDRLQAYNQLLWHRASRGQVQRASVLARQALADPLVTKNLDGFWGFSRVLTPLAASYPKEAADLFVEGARVALAQASTLDVARLLNDVMVAFIDAPPAQVAPAVRTLLPVVSDPNFPRKGSSPGAVERQVNGQNVVTHDAHETVLFHFGLFAHVLAPDIYQHSRSLFEPWDAVIRSVDSREKLLQGRQARPSVPTYMGAAGAEAFAAVEKLPKAEDRIYAFEKLALRNDFTPEQRADAIERARKLIRADLSATLAKPARDSLTLHTIARNLRWAGIAADSEDPGLQAKLALIDLEDAVQPAYDFSLSDPSGKSRRLHDERGKVVLINFWATWCPPCRAEMPMLSKLNREWGPKGLAILAISDEPAETVISYERQFEYGLSVLLDPSRKVFDHYRVQGIPDTRILDQSGRVVATFGELVSEQQIVSALREAGLK